MLGRLLIEVSLWQLRCKPIVGPSLNNLSWAWSLARNRADLAFKGLKLFDKTIGDHIKPYKLDANLQQQLIWKEKVKRA